MPFFFWKISPLHQLLLRGGSHRLLIENNEPFFLPSLSYYFTPAYIITSLAHRRFGIFLSNMTCGWEVDTNFKLFWCVTLLVFPISAGFSLPIHFTVFTNWRGGNEQFSELGYWSDSARTVPNRRLMINISPTIEQLGRVLLQSRSISVHCRNTCRVLPWPQRVFLFPFRRVFFFLFFVFVWLMRQIDLARLKMS